MNPHLVYESLFFANRDTLDACMLASSVLKDIIGNSKRLDVLRLIGVFADECTGALDVHIYRVPERPYRPEDFEEHEAEEQDPLDEEERATEDEDSATEEDPLNRWFSRVYKHESEWPELMPRIDNCYVKHLTICWPCSTFVGFLANRVEKATGPVRFRIGTLTLHSDPSCVRRDDDPGEHSAHQVAKVLQITKFDLGYNSYLDYDYLPHYDHLPLEHPPIHSSIEELKLQVLNEAVPRRLMRFLCSGSALQHCYLEMWTSRTDPLAAARWVDAYIREFKEAPDGCRMVPSLTVHTFLGGRPEVLSKVELWKHIPEVCDRPVKSAPIPPGATQRLFDLYGPFHYYNYDDRPTCTRFTFGSRGKRLQVSIWQATVRPSRISVATIVYHCTFQ